MAKRLFYNDIIISKVIEVNKKTGWKKNQVIDIALQIELKHSLEIVKVLKRVFPSGYYVASIGSGQYRVGSVYSSK